MTPREKLTAALEHRAADELPFDLGATKATGISASLLYRLRKLYGRDEPVKIHDTYQMLGLIDEQDYEAFGIDVAGVCHDITCFGYRNKDWKPWITPDGTPALIGGQCNMSTDAAGNLYIHPQGDLQAKPSGRMPKGGHYFDQLSRQEPFDEDDLDARWDYNEQFYLYDEETLDSYAKDTDYLYKHTNMGIVINAECAAFGSTTNILAPMLKRTTGIRDISEWMMAPYLYPDYVKEVLELQAERGIENLKLLYEAVGNKPQVIFLSATDFGTQRGLLISKDFFREFYVPYYKRINDWIHTNTTWRTLLHCCGGISDIMDDMCYMGVDCLNPIQADAAGMNPAELKERFDDRLVFWGAAVDNQTTLCQGTPADVEKQFLERTKTLRKNGGFVCAITHNLQDTTPMENVQKVFELIKR